MRVSKSEPLLLGSIIGVVEVPAVAKDERGNEGPQVHPIAGPDCDHLDPD